MKQSEVVNYFTPEEDNFIAQGLMEGKLPSEIAIAMRRPISSVRVRISRTDYLRSIIIDRKKNRKMEIYELYKNSDLSMAKIGEKYGISRGAIRLIIIECEGALHTPYAKKKRTEFSKEEDALIKSFKSENKSLDFIAARLDRNKSSVRSRIKTLEKKELPNGNLFCFYCQNKILLTADSKTIWDNDNSYHDNCYQQRKRVLSFLNGTLPLLKVIGRERGLTEGKKEVLEVLRLNKHITYAQLSKATGYDYESCKYAVNSLKQMGYITEKNG